MGGWLPGFSSAGVCRSRYRSPFRSGHPYVLWIAFHLPHLPLEALLRGCDPNQWSDEPWAVIENRSVFVHNAAAQALGVRSGMPLSAAWALAPALRTVPRNLRAERENLEGVAAWLGRFTPRVSLEAPCQVAAEVAGSLRLFGGLERLEQALRSGLDALGFGVRLASAPTARAALWRAAGGASALEDLRVEVTGAGADSLALLRSLGIRTLGELMRLPRDGVARRLGQELLDELDRALGKIPEPRASFVPPVRFAARLELPAQVTEAEGLLFAAHRLLVQLEGVLVARQSGIRGFTLSLRHPGMRPTPVTVPLASPSRDATHFTVLLRERLTQLELIAPVEAIRLQAADFEPLHGTTASLFRDAHDAGEGWGRLLDRLAARLGETAVRGLAVHSEHRPELASQAVAPESSPGARPTALPGGPRPLWLLETPRHLGENEFVLLTGPERIESGWWDGGEVRRDYFIARTGDASLVWIFRERERGWFLHGIFA
ncbi:MAG: DNA polymerase Y family protein [Betaproteobacteria bacterium]|nr:MAG: DNA polymerase Y family protein [Betaproteobacteria bacterium]